MIVWHSDEKIANALIGKMWKTDESLVRTSFVKTVLLVFWREAMSWKGQGDHQIAMRIRRLL